MTSYTPQAVLWDMDGTIVDTEPQWIAAQNDFLTRRGLPQLSAEQERRLVGASPTITAEVFAEQGVTDSPAEIAAEVTAQVVQSLRSGVSQRPGAYELIQQQLAAGVPIALVTNSSHSLVNAVLTGLELQDCFDAIVAAEDVGEGKPSPEPFLLAADKLGVAPERCLVIEDSLNGLRGALAAGCTALAVPHGVDIPESEHYLRRDTLEGLNWQTLCSLVAHVCGEHS